VGDIIYLDPGRLLKEREGNIFTVGRSKELIVIIPPGMKEGQKIRVEGNGRTGKEAGEAGDLYLKVKIKEPLLERIKNFLKVQSTL